MTAVTIPRPFLVDRPADPTSTPEETAMPAQINRRDAATLAGRITITPVLDREEMRRLPSSYYIRVAIADGPSDGMGLHENLGVAIVPGPVEPLATGGVARDIKDLIAAFPGHRFEGELVRTAGAKLGAGQRRIVADGETVRY